MEKKERKISLKEVSVIHPRGTDIFIRRAANWEVNVLDFKVKIQNNSENVK